MDSVLVGNSRTCESLNRHNLMNFWGEREDGRKGQQPTCIVASHQNKSFKVGIVCCIRVLGFGVLIVKFKGSYLLLSVMLC